MNIRTFSNTRSRINDAQFFVKKVYYKNPALQCMLKDITPSRRS